MASSKSDKLSLLHAAKLTLASKLGIPLDRWSNGITVLLEKTFGATLIDQLRAICLFEADYNWLMKIIFAKRMMDNAHKKGLIPDEHFARSGSQVSEGALVKVLMNDRTRVLHVTTAVSSCDLEQCYDRGAHPIAAIALQAFGISAIMVGVMLKVLQRMKYYLRSGFGDAVTPSFQGTDETPLFCFGQGNDAAPSSFQVLATLMMNAYIGLGHSVIMKSAITGALFSLAAVMYVDDTDLFQVAKRRYMTDEEFLAQVQLSVTDWGKLVQATGGALKQKKCWWYLLSFKFVMGIPRYKTVAELPTTPLVIPQVDGTTLPITLKEPSEASKTLGVRAAPDGNPVAHLAHMKKCGLDWGDRLHTTYLPRHLAWMSHDLQLYPQMSYGLECLLATPMELSKEMRKVICHCLPPLGVNRNIKSEFATISHKYQGISLPDWTAEKLARDVNVLFRHWGLPTAVGKLLRHSYELLQMETGLQGNIFARSFATFGCLASHS